ncbi:MAG TPA: hypothetical protein PKJ62_05065, partial [Bacteroidia bacterium]|nr:hypothetical protein [Bacteroidia bacterium]
FAVKDTSDISKIFLADRNGNSVTLKRQPDGSWIMNDSFPPRPDMTKYLLQAIYSLSVKSRIPKAGFNNVINDLAASAIKCEIYLKDNEKAHKVYYVGGQTADALGTLMMIENSSIPFVTEVPGFNGYLTPRYSPSQSVWLEPIIFRYRIGQIKKLQIEYPGFPQHDFRIEKNQDKYTFQILTEDNPRSDVDSVAIDNYLALYQQVFYEVIDSRLSDYQKDSLLNTVPLTQIEIESVDNVKNGITIFPMAINENSLAIQDSVGNPLTYDLDRMFGYIKSKDQWVVIQHYTFDKLFLKPNNFLIKKRL